MFNLNQYTPLFLLIERTDLVIAYAYATISLTGLRHILSVKNIFELLKSSRTHTQPFLILTSCFPSISMSFFYSSNATYTGQDFCGDDAADSFMLYDDLLTDIDTDTGSSVNRNTATDLPPHVQQWISDASPSALTKVSTLDFTRLKARKCCRLRCMHILPVDLVRACCLHYYSMSQLASHQWLATILKNQPSGHKMFYLLSTVPPPFLATLALINQSIESVQEGISPVSWSF